VLISDLIGAGSGSRCCPGSRLTDAGVQVVVLLALSNDGAPVFDQENAAALAGTRGGRLRLHPGRVR
jgi:hypothetical protein